MPKVWVAVVRSQADLPWPKLLRPHVPHALWGSPAIPPWQQAQYACMSFLIMIRDFRVLFTAHATHTLQRRSRVCV